MAWVYVNGKEAMAFSPLPLDGWDGWTQTGTEHTKNGNASTADAKKNYHQLPQNGGAIAVTNAAKLPNGSGSGGHGNGHGNR